MRARRAEPARAAMKPILVLVSILASVAVVLVVALKTGTSAPPADAGSDAPSNATDRVDAQARRIEALEKRIAELERRGSIALDAERAPADPRPTVSTTVLAPGEHDARWYLEQYVASFDGGGEGSEYYRLVVDAHVVELVGDVCLLAVDRTRPVAMRVALVTMLGKPRLRGNGQVIEALVLVLRQSESEPLALACVASWRKAGDAASAERLEGILWHVAAHGARERALDLLIELAGEHANQVLLRLLATAPDDPSAAWLIARIDAADLDGALDVFRRTSQMDKMVRLVAARRIGEFETPPFAQFVEEWLRVETDPQVIEALRGAREQQRTTPGWSAMQAAGPPNADAHRDDSNAWAPRDPEMGLQWLDLVYASPDRISGVRIHETCTSGAVSELRARDTDGAWHVLWTGTANGGLDKPLEITFAPTSWRVQAVRVVLDTDRTIGWNEIDAVEILGLAGGQYAASATASSTFAQRGGAAQMLNGALLDRGLRFGVGR